MSLASHASSVDNGVYVNVDNSHTTGIPFSNTIPPSGEHTLPAPGGRVESAAGMYPGTRQMGGRRRRRHASTRSSRRSKKRAYSKKRVYRRKSRRHHRRQTSKKHVRFFRGGMPSYPAGYSQFDSNKIISNNFSLADTKLAASNSALANPPPYQGLAPEVDNLNHAAPNAYGNYGAGSGFPSRGWF